MNNEQDQKTKSPHLLQAATKADIIVMQAKLLEAQELRFAELMAEINELKGNTQNITRNTNNLSCNGKTATIKEFYTTKEFCEITGMKYKTVVAYCNSGKLKATTVSKDEGRHSWMIHREEIDNLVERAHKNVLPQIV